MRSFLPALFLSLTACSSTVTDLHDDAGADASPTDVPSSGSCDPHRAPCRVTLTCPDYERCEGVHLATGRVERFDRSVTPRAGDVQVALGRYLGLSGASSFCRFGMSPGTSTASFGALTEVPTDPARCAWDMGANLLCGVNTSAYTPSCVGAGLLVRDAAAQLYRLRVLDDRADASGWHVEFEWVAIDG
jgi:hypothetical protein